MDFFGSQIFFNEMNCSVNNIDYTIASTAVIHKFRFLSVQYIILHILYYTDAQHAFFFFAFLLISFNVV